MSLLIAVFLLIPHLSFAYAVDISTISSSEAFAARRDLYLDAVIARSGTTPRHFRVCQALAILARARDTGDKTRVAKANQLIVDTLNELPAVSSKWSEFKQAYGQGALDYLRILFLYGDDPTLVFPSTRTKLLNGGTSTSLRYYQKNMCYNTRRKVGLRDYNPWAPAAGTFNHQINEIATGLLIAQLYAGETYAAPDGTYPMKDDTDEGLYDANDYWHYWRNAFYKYLTRYGSPADPKANRHMNWGNHEKDSVHYLPMYIGAYLNIRDFVADPTVSKYAEIYLDAMMADYAEDAVGDLSTGAHKRTYSGYIRAIRHWFHGVISHLWFANVAYPLKDLGQYLYSWGGAGHTAMATSDYNPAHPDFPQVLIEIVVNKPPGGYMVTESVSERKASDYLDGEQGNWVMPDYAMGFQLDNWAGQSHSAGGVYIDNTNGSTDGGLLIAPFVGTKAGHANANDPDYRYNPKTTVNGLLRPDVAILQYKENEAAFDPQELPCRIWIKDGFAELDLDSPWIFARARSALGRDIYVAVRTILGGHSNGGTSDGGSVRICNDGDDYLLWETSTSDTHASFDAFKTDVQNNPLVVGETWIQYTSCRGESLSYHRTSMSSHKVDGVTIERSQFAHVVKNPFVSWTHEEREITMAKAGYTAFIDFDGNDDGVFDDPVKVVNNVVRHPKPDTKPPAKPTGFGTVD